MVHRKFFIAGLTGCMISMAVIGGNINALAQETQTGAAQIQELAEGWRQDNGTWMFWDAGGILHKGWLQDQGRIYYLDESGWAVTGWREIGGEWYYFHEDGAMNQGELILGNGKYEFSDQGALVSASWVENTGGGPYIAGCYDEVTQTLFDNMNEKKKELYFDQYPDREEAYGSDMHRVYDRYAGFQMDAALNKAAAHRLAAAVSGGYLDGRIPGEGTISEYLNSISYRKSATCLELYIRDCEDEGEAFDKILSRTRERYDSKGDRKDSLGYYRTLGMAHVEKDRKQYFMIIMTR